MTEHDGSATLPLNAFLDELEAPAPSPSGGTAAAISAAMAAALLTMVGRASSDWDDGAGVAAQAHTLRVKLLELGEADARAYGAVLQAMRDAGSGTPQQRDFALGQALVVAALMPLAIAECAADVAELAALAAVHGKESLRPDAAVAAALAEAAAHSGAYLVEVNLATVPGDELSTRAEELVEAARGARARAVASL